MQRIVLTGGPGSGKTSVLNVLRNQGYETGEDAARSIIRERKGDGLSPRPDAQAFAKQIYERELEAYRLAAHSPSFFERGVVDAVGFRYASGDLAAETVSQILCEYRYQKVFIFPPWEEIYRVDEERDHTFEHSVRVYESTLNLYRRHDYDPIEVPFGSIEERAEFVLGRIGDS